MKGPLSVSVGLLLTLAVLASIASAATYRSDGLYGRRKRSSKYSLELDVKTPPKTGQESNETKALIDQELIDKTKSKVKGAYGKLKNFLNRKLGSGPESDDSSAAATLQKREYVRRQRRGGFNVKISAQKDSTPIPFTKYEVIAKDVIRDLKTGAKRRWNKLKQFWEEIF